LFSELIFLKGNILLLDIDDSQLVLVDYQTKLMPHIFEDEQVLANAIRLAKIARLLQVPVFGAEQNPNGLGANVDAVRSLCTKTLMKHSFDACQDGLIDWLRPIAKQQGGNARSLPKHLQKAVPSSPERSSVVIAGCEAHVCLLQTSLSLLEQEFDVWVVTDACGSRTERSRDAAFDRLAGAGAELVTTEMVAFEWLRTNEHEAFKDVLAILK
jgi:nicotinamidase-related amidase